MTEAITRIFFPILNPIFSPINDFLVHLDAAAPVAKRLVTLGLFLGTMLWVYVGLRKQYVNLDAPSNRFWADLRLWTVISMLPHIFVYLYF
ncbi:MAG TPA: hypothetical protein PLO37_25790 [Candidatus Hydrogenedentes bacterium]|nr:hypothetical protein [Candidatus Hydrogenedentota bacterium]HPG70269.1 hypothetical protein [Candidatus Hydrogenedentota bacterium]